MNTMESWRTALVAFSLLLICVLVWPVPSLAGGKKGEGGSSDSGRFTCRASALRIDELVASIFEPVVANSPEDPCKTDAKSLLSVGPVVGVSADVLVANTEDGKAPVTAEGFAVGTDINLTSLNLAALVSAEVLDATARVDSVGGKCVLSSESSVTSALVNGTPIDVGANHLDVTIPLAGIVHFNETLGGSNPTSGAPNLNKVTQRALWVQITNPLLQDATGVEEVIVGEAIADFEGG